MKKNLVRMTLCMFILTIFTTSVHAQWIKTNWPAGNVFFNLYSNQNRVFARTWDALNGGRMFLSVDNGSNWAQIGSADSSSDILSIVMVNNDILAGTWNGCYQSASGGSTWKTLTPAGLPDTAIWSIEMIGSTLYAGTKGAVYKSSDSGATWTEVKSGIPMHACIRSITSIGNTIFAGSDTSGIFMTTNNGTSWTAINSGLSDRRISQLTAMGTRVFAVTLSTVFISDNNGTSWAANNSSLKNINCFIVVNNQLFAGTDSSGVFLSTDSGATWTSFSSGMPANTRIWSMAATRDNLFTGTDSGVWRTPFATIAIPASGTSRLTHSRLHFRRQNGSRATITFACSSPETVNLRMYDLCGNELLSLINKKFGAGLQSVSFATGSFAPGSYVIKLTAGAVEYHQTVAIQR